MQMKIEEVYDEHAKRVYAFFYVKTFDQMLAEDLTSQTFMTMVEKMCDEDVTIQNHATYLSGIMRNVWLRHLQAKYRQQVTSIEDIDNFERFIDKTVRDAEDDGLETFARPFIEQLPSKQRVILEKRLLEKQTLKEICDDLDKDMNYVRTTQQRGINRLREMVASADVSQAKEAA